MRKSSTLFLVGALALSALAAAAPAQAAPPIALADSATPQFEKFAAQLKAVDSISMVQSVQAPSIAAKTATVALKVVTASLNVTAAIMRRAVDAVDAGSCGDGLPLAPGCERYVRREISKLTNDSPARPPNT